MRGASLSFGVASFTIMWLRRTQGDESNETGFPKPAASRAANAQNSAWHRRSPRCAPRGKPRSGHLDRGPSQLGASPLCCHDRHYAGHGVGKVVMRTGAVVHTVAPARAVPPLEAAQLAQQLRDLRQLHAAAVHCGQELEVEVGLRRLAEVAAARGRRRGPLRTGRRDRGGCAVALRLVGADPTPSPRQSADTVRWANLTRLRDGAYCPDRLAEAQAGSS